MPRLVVALFVLVIVVGVCLGACDPQSEESKRWNVLLVSADSLRSDRLALYDRQGVATPNLEALAARGAVYRNAWAVTPWTAPSMVSVFTGLYPPSHGVAYRDDTTPPSLPTLASLLEEAGYRVGNFTFFSEISYFRNLGLPPRAEGLVAHGRETGAVLEWLDAWRVEGGPMKPFFAWVHLLEPHLPYGASGYRATEVSIPGSSGLERSQLQATVPVGSAEFAPGDREKLLELYDRDVERLDRVIGELLGGLRRRGLEQSTLVVFVADHGEELLEHGWVGHASTAIEAKLRPELLRIPLILAGPGVEPGGEHGETVQQVDILPSVLDLLGLGAPARLDGAPLPGTRAPGRRGLLSRLGAGLRRAVPGASSRRFDLAYFDTSTGGNLTPVERVGERLQGVTDGDCLLESPLVPGAPVPVEPRLFAVADATVRCEERRGRLTAALSTWREEQARQRLAVLRGESASDAPGAEAESWEQTIVVRQPASEQEIGWDGSGGQITLEWEGSSPAFWVEYRVGALPALVEGSFRVEQARVRFGPFPQGFWNDIAGYSPFRFRVLDPTRRERSPWVAFRVRAVTASDRLAGALGS